jgi:hypothetical protein
MKTPTPYTLSEAIRLIELQGKQVEFIEYEDGSGVKFNYRLKGETQQRFTDLSNMVDSIIIGYGTKP